MTFLKLNFTKKIFLILIITAIFSVTTFLNNTIASGLKILGQGIFDNTATSSLSIDTNNRKLISSDGLGNNLNWSTTPASLLVNASTTDGSAVLQVKGVNNIYTSPNISGGYVNSVFPGMAEIYGAYDAGTYVDYSAGSFMNTEIYFQYYQYAIAPDGVRFYSYGGSSYVYDYSSQPFQIMLNWMDYGGTVPTVGYIIYAYDYSSGQDYWIDVPANLNSLTVTDFSTWNYGGIYDVWYGYYSPYPLSSTGNLYGDQYYYIWAFKETNGIRIYSEVYTSAYSSDYYWTGYKNDIYWDEAVGADGYLVWNNYNYYYIVIDNPAILSVTDDGVQSGGWEYGEPTITYPYSSIGDLGYFDNGINQITIKSDGQLVSNTAEGTAPFSILSTTLVNNLNADLLDGYHVSDYVLTTQSLKYDGGITIPTIVGQSGKVLTNNGSALSWETALTAEADTLATVTARGAITDTPLTVRSLNVADGYNLIFGTSTGTKIGTATNQKLAFFGVTPIVQPINTVPLDTVLVNLGLQASGGNPSVSTNFKIGSNVNRIDYTLTFDGETTDGVITWMEKKDQFKFNDRLQTDGGRIGKVVIPPDGSYGTRYDETIVGTVGNIFILPIYPPDGTIFTFKNIGASPITISPNTSQLINGVAAPITLSQWSSKRVQYVLSAGGYIAY
jgi:hypothetical protein